MLTAKRDPENRFTLAALAHLMAAQDARNRYHVTIRQAIAEYGDLPMGVSATSGVYCTSWPEPVKDRARVYARLIGEHTDLALQCWQRSGRTLHTFRETERPFRMLPDGRESYY